MCFRKGHLWQVVRLSMTRTSRLRSQAQETPQRRIILQWRQELERLLIQTFPQ